MKSFIALLLLVGVAFGQLDYNWNGWGDSSNIASFKADSLKYSKIFNLSGMENMRLDCYAADTGVAGFASDSMAFQWGIQTGHLSCFSTTSTVTASAAKIVWALPMVIDSFCMSVASTAAATLKLDTLSGQYIIAGGPLSYIDTSKISGWAYQTRQPPAEWDQVFRFWAKGGTANNKSGFLKLVFQVGRRDGVVVKSR